MRGVENFKGSYFGVQITTFEREMLDVLKYFTAHLIESEILTVICVSFQLLYNE